MQPRRHTISFTALPGISHHEHTLHNLVQDIARLCAVMKQLHSIVRFLIPTILIALFFYFFGLSTLRKGMLKDVVAVSCKPFMRFDRSSYCDGELPTVYPATYVLKAPNAQQKKQRK